MRKSKENLSKTMRLFEKYWGKIFIFFFIVGSLFMVRAPLVFWEEMLRLTAKWMVIPQRMLFELVDRGVNGVLFGMAIFAVVLFCYELWEHEEIYTGKKIITYFKKKGAISKAILIGLMSQFFYHKALHSVGFFSVTMRKVGFSDLFADSIANLLFCSAVFLKVFVFLRFMPVVLILILEPSKKCSQALREAYNMTKGQSSCYLLILWSYIWRASISAIILYWALNNFIGKTLALILASDVPIVFCIVGILGYYNDLYTINRRGMKAGN